MTQKPQSHPHDLPQFARRTYAFVHTFTADALTNLHVAETTQLRHLIAYDDGHFRALFDPAYFVLQPGRSEPSKSQWNTLKKHLKHLDRRVFIFKQYGTLIYEGQVCCYLDFGFLKD